ncbi:hypothetical protein MUU47_15375 [Scandinavium sp. H11S7]|uniref:Fimbrial protein n=1 Tax=Scandinavium hiltneri TaxID=2926519 RepID=A0ABT2E650_9ENTR|nr:hypothetical protein [Scandinavium hiltneri]MCS2162477.1 hypothetical protein [Scandinavium hiltneri]
MSLYFRAMLLTSLYSLSFMSCATCPTIPAYTINVNENLTINTSVTIPYEALVLADNNAVVRISQNTYTSTSYAMNQVLNHTPNNPLSHKISLTSPPAPENIPGFISPLSGELLSFYNTDIPGIYIAMAYDPVIPDVLSSGPYPASSVPGDKRAQVDLYAPGYTDGRVKGEVTYVITKKFVDYINQNNMTPGDSVSTNKVYNYTTEISDSAGRCPSYPTTGKYTTNLVATLPNIASCRYDTEQMISMGFKTEQDLPAVEDTSSLLTRTIDVSFSCSGATTLFAGLASNVIVDSNKPYIIKANLVGTEDDTNIGAIFSVPAKAGTDTGTYTVLTKSAGGTDPQQPIIFHDQAWYTDDITQNVAFKLKVGKIDTNAPVELGSYLITIPVSITYQ